LLKTTSAEEQSLKFSVKVVNNAAASAVQLAKCILFHAYSHTTVSFQLRGNKQKLHTAFKQASITVFMVIS